MIEDAIPLRIRPITVAARADQPASKSDPAETADPSKNDVHPRFVSEVEPVLLGCNGTNNIPLFLGIAPPTPPEENQPPVEKSAVQRGSRRWTALSPGFLVVIVVLLLIAIWMVQAVVSWAIRVGETHPALGIACNALLAIGAALILYLIAREIRSHWSLLKLGDMQMQLGRARAGQLATKDDERLKVRFRSVAKRLKANGTIAEDVNRDILTLIVDSNMPGDWVEPACRRMLQTMDERVKALIEHEARLIGVGTALSPSGPLDAAIVLWRNSRLVLQIAEIYGIRPRGYQSFRLLRRVVSNTVIAGLSQEAMQMLYAAYGPAAVEAASRGFRCIFDLIYRGGIMLAMVEPISGSLIAAGGAIGKGVSDVAGAAAAQVTGPLLQGLLNAVLTVRIGLIAQNECRLLALTDEERRVESASIVSTLLGFFLQVRRGTRPLGQNVEG